MLPLLWEFPGGKVEEDESNDDALKREVLHRLNVRVEPGILISFVSHPYEKYVVDLYMYECRLISGEVKSANVHAFKWVKSSQFDDYAFTPADERSMSQLLGVG